MDERMLHSALRPDEQVTEGAAHEHDALVHEVLEYIGELVGIDEPQEPLGVATETVLLPVLDQRSRQFLGVFFDDRCAGWTTLDGRPVLAIEFLKLTHGRVPPL